jgi:hypothetical protein
MLLQIESRQYHYNQSNFRGSIMSYFYSITVYFGVAFVLLGFLISRLVVKDTRKFTALEIKENLKESTKASNDSPNGKDIAVANKKFGSLNFMQVLLKPHGRIDLSLPSQAGLVNNLIFGVSWGLFTLYFATFSISVSDFGFLKALHRSVLSLAA